MSINSDRHDYRALLARANRTLAAMQERLARAERSNREPIAIVGMGLRFPGGACDAASFWSILHDGVDAVTEIPPDRWNADDFFDADPDALGKTYSRWTGFVDGVDHFDPSFFGISPREAAAMDPQHRLLLEVAWEALENAGHGSPALVGSSTGVFIGMVGSDYATLPKGDLRMDAYFGTGISRSIAAGRLSYAFGLQGPNMAIDTACSSSAVSTHLACLSLRAGECSMALAGGVNLVLTPDGSVSASRARMMSFTGRCRTFDAGADGYVRAEGCAVLVLKRLSDAVADRDNILGVILGTAVNQDGRSNGITAPNGQAQELILRAALDDAGLAPDAVSVVEAHGTGTPLGDPIEMKAIGSVFGAGRASSDPLLVSSIKTNIGHTEAVAGTAGLIKLLLAMQHGSIPPHLHLRDPNPFIDWDRLPVRVPTEPTPWIVGGGGRRIAGVSSFGFSGTNSHIILAEAPALPARIPVAERPYRLLALSAKTPAALESLARSYAGHLCKAPAREFRDVTFTANTGRTHFPSRIAVLSSSAGECAGKLGDWVSGETTPGVFHGDSTSRPEVAFLFTGQGSQYVGMGRALFQTEPVFRSVLERCDELLRPHLQRSLLSIIHPRQGEETDAERLIHETAFTQPALFAIEYALAELWRSWGIEPTLVTGHSVGEYVAACVAGVFSLEQGLELIAARGRLMQRLPTGGGMAAVFCDDREIVPLLAPFSDRLSIAAYNGPGNLVISGDSTALARVLETLTSRGIGSRPLTVSHAFHSPLMKPMLEEFAAVASAVAFEPPRIGLVANLSGDVAGEEIASSDYWVKHVLAPVRFEQAIETLGREGCSTLIEVGPAPTLLGMVARCRSAAAFTCLPSMRPGRGDDLQMLESLGTLYANGAEIAWAGVERDEGQRRVPLPTYPFQRQRYWASFSSPRPQADDQPWIHPLIQDRLRSPLLAGVAFTSRLGTETRSYLGDHRVFGSPLMPATGFIEMAVAGARLAFGAPARLLDLRIREPLEFSDSTPIQVQLAVATLDHGSADFQIVSLADSAADEWRLHATGRMSLEEAEGREPESIDGIMARCTTEMAVDLLYDRFSELGVEYRGSFRSLRAIWRRDGEALGRVELPESLQAEAVEHGLHPGLLDACLQLLGPALPEAENVDEAEAIFLPVEIGSFVLHASGRSSAWCRATISRTDARGELFTGSLTLFDEQGALLAVLQGITLKRTTRTALGKAKSGASRQKASDWLYSVRWDAAEIAARASEAASRFILIADEAEGAESIGSTISEMGGQWRMVRPEALTGLAPDALRSVLLADQGVGTPPVCIVYLAGIGDAQEMEGLDGEEIMRIQKRACGGILGIVQALAGAAEGRVRLRLVTRYAQAVSGDDPPVTPAATAVWGLASTIVAEHPELGCACVDLGDRVDLGTLVAELHANEGEDRVALRAGGRYVARLVSTPPSPALNSASPDGGVELHITEKGILENLVLRPETRRGPGPGEVEVEVRASGLNFRDVINALGMYPGNAGPLGSECAGRICAVGEGAMHFRVGDEVVLLSAGTFRSHVVAPASAVYPKPGGMSYEDAVTIPITFLTAFHGLHDLAGIRPGDRVLIHAAAGGVGLAAVQLAQQAGAIVFGTAGSAEKHAYLRSIGVQHIMSSRDLNFSHEILDATGGAGVDIVLNSLSDEFIPHSLSVLADGGCFLEIGKRGIWTTEQVAALRPGVRYFAYDLAEPMAADPLWMTSVLDRLVPEFESGNLRPLPVHSYPLDRSADAFRFMAQARHTGKIVITQDPPRSARSNPVLEDRSYLVTGGLGGLGLVVAKGLAERGARDLVLLGRRPPSDEARELIATIEESGARVRVIQGDVASTVDVQRAVEAAGALAPLGGVIHAAGVIDDGVLLKQSWERFETVMRPKVQGSWNLHLHTRDLPIDFFVLFSTASALLGSSGQGNYSYANAFLDGLAHHRRAAGLPAISINWGAWSGVGMAAALAERDVKRWSERGSGMIDPESGIQVLNRILDEGPTQIAVLPIDWSRFIRQSSEESIPPFLANLAARVDRNPSPEKASSGDFLRRLEALGATAIPDAVRAYVEERVARVLGLDPSVPLPPQQGLSDMGMDSLMAVELSNHFANGFGRKFPSTLAYEYGTIALLSDHLVREVLPANDAESLAVDHRVGVSGSEGTEYLETVSSVAALNDEEAEIRLVAELDRAGY